MDTAAFYAGQQRRRLALPTYPFERQRYFVEPAEGQLATVASRRGKNPDLTGWFYLPTWERTIPLSWMAPADSAPSRWLIFLDESRIGRQLAETLRDRGHSVTTVNSAEDFAASPSQYHVRAGERDDYVELVRALRESGNIPDRIVHLWTVGMPGAYSDSDLQTRGFLSLLYLAQALGQEDQGRAVSLNVITSDAQMVLGSERVAPAKAMVSGPCEVIPLEYPRVHCRAIDLSLDAASVDVSKVAGDLLSELTAATDESVVALRSGQRWTRGFTKVRLAEAPSPSPLLRERGAYMITGGLGGVGLELARYLAEKTRARLVLVGRSELPPRNRWPELVSSGVQSETITRIRKVIDLENAGAEVLVASADVSSREQMVSVFASVRERFGQLHGIIHAAALPAATVIARHDAASTRKVLDPKVKGAQVLYDLTRDSGLDFLMLCSSQRSFLGAPGQIDYCAANAFLDAFASSRSIESSTRIMSVVWDTWAEQGMAARIAAGSGSATPEAAMTNREGAEVFHRILSRPHPVVIVSTEDFASRAEQSRKVNVDTLLGELEKKHAASARHPRPDLASAYVAPRSPAEEKLAEIWQNLLGIEPVGVNDNFFDLGGDSVISIQIIARAQQAGLALNPKHVFQHQTIAELATVAGRVGAAREEQGIVSGDVPLTPIQAWFVEQNFARPGHFNQSVLLQPRRRIEPAIARAAFEFLVRHHDALRLRLVNSAHAWRALIGDATADECFAVHDLRTTPAGELASAIERIAAQAQSTLNLSRGPIARADLIECPNGAQRLLLVVHHVAVDAVSWRILLEDFETACRQLQAREPVSLPVKTTSWKRWAEHLSRQAKSGAFDAELEYWLEQDRQPVLAWPSDRECRRDEETQSTAATVALELSQEETRGLLQDVRSAYGVQISDALVAALLRTVGSRTGSRRVRIDAEGLGRETGADDLDLSRTVGWFTALHPIAIDADQAAGHAELLATVKEQLRRVPRGGVGYGALRYLSGHGDEFRTAPASEICFLYLGQIRGSGEQDGLFDQAKESGGPNLSAGTRLPHRLTLTAIVAGDRLRVSWMYSNRAYDERTIRGIAGDYMNFLRELLAETRKTKRLRWAPDAASAFRWSSAEIDRIDAALEASLGEATAAEVECVYPLSPMQQGMLFHSLYDPAAHEYLKRLVIEIEGDLQIENLKAAWQFVMERHPVLRSSFVWEGLGQPVQAVMPSPAAPWHVADLRSFEHGERSLRLQRLLEEDERQDIDLARAPLMRFSVVRTGHRLYTFVWTFHHILLDGWSIARIVQEAFAAYDSAVRRTPTPELPAVPYRDFMVWLKSQDGARAEEFWRACLSGLEGPTPLGVDRAPTAVQSRSYREVRAKLSPEATVRLQAFARAERLTMNTVTAAAWAILLSRYSGRSDVTFGSVVSGRPADLAGVESIVGLLINTLPVRAHVEPGASLGSWLREFQQRQIESRNYEFVSLTDIQKWSGLPPSQPLFDSVLVFENYPVSSLTAEIANLRLRDVRAEERTSLPLTFVIGAGRQISLIVSYDTARFDPDTIDRMLGHYCVLLESMGAGAERSLSELPLLSSHEREEIVLSWNATEESYPADRCVHQLFEVQAARTPDSTAVVFGDESLTYGDLNRRANLLARFLRQRGVRPGSLVGIFLDRSLDMMVGLLAVQKAGGAYVPLDPAYPPERVAFMIEDSGMTLVLTQERLLEALPCKDVEAICIDSDWQLGVELDSRRPAANPSPDDLAYVIYTSGSTGRPKGVQIPHRAVVNFLASMRAEPGFTEDDVLLAVTTLSFDIAGLELFLPLTVGGRVVIASREAALDGAELARLMESSGATAMQATPASWRMLIDAGWEGDPDLTILCGGEALARDLADQLLPKCASLWNMYGPTETTIWSAVHRVTPGDGPVLIGRPIANTQIYILDQQMNPVPVGVAGELFIGGLGLARGYWNRPELTAEKFVPDPFRAAQGARMYRTGDLARYHAGGLIECLGRLDHQVKIRGFRIELGEIESVLREFPGIHDCVVVAREDAPGDKRLVAYYSADASAKPNVSDLRAHLQQRLPHHMIPSLFVALEALPLTPNGKVDRRSLPAPDHARPDLAAGYHSPADEVEGAIAAIWQRVLQLQQVGTEDNFFDLGGHSLMMVQVHGQIRRSLDVEISMMDLFRYPTVKSLAEYLRKGSGEAPALQKAQDRATMRREAMTRRKHLRNARNDQPTPPSSRPAMVEE
ncbi:MAG TPA: amino acid adenylation domain-containing protein [Verrucomicrobiae bacterium]|nr:amino acid adenylation domain-containing protein [Verrucomicrobiae bacterium]